MNFIRNNSPRWLIFLADIILIFISITLAYQTRFNFDIPANELRTLPYVYSFFLCFRILSFVLGKTYVGIIKYTGVQDAIRIAIVLCLGSLFFVISNIISHFVFNAPYIIPFSIIIIELFASILFLVGVRLIIKMLYLEMFNPTKNKQKLIIYGAGESGLITKRALDRDLGTKFKVIAFIDDDNEKIGRSIEGVKVLGPVEFEKVLQEHEIEQVILAIQNVDADKKTEIVDKCIKYSIKPLIVPPVGSWINGELSSKQIKQIKIEDLLERNVIHLNIDAIRKELLGETIMITGAAGSIGSEIVRQIASFQSSKLILVDQAESAIYRLDLELRDRFPHCDFIYQIADISNKERMQQIMSDYKPSRIYHAAAYKHVPIMERNPKEAIGTNVFGTCLLADLAVEYGVDKFVMVSTDKAVNPTNVMGASKRIAEIYCQSLGKKQSKTKFITTRFGNVLGSDGSVIPLFRDQISKGGPLTITHREITRYFMTIPEACQLVLEAGSMGHGGEIYIFDMGKAVKIDELAKKMINLSGLTLGKDINITYTGLREGEKLYEELLNTAEGTLKTYHPKIKIAKVREYQYETVKLEIQKFKDLLNNNNDFEVVRHMKDMVPEFISQNSIFEKLDIK